MRSRVPFGICLCSTHSFLGGEAAHSLGRLSIDGGWLWNEAKANRVLNNTDHSPFWDAARAGIAKAAIGSQHQESWLHGWDGFE